MDKETAHHFLMRCPAYAEARRDMVREGGRNTLIIGKLLSDGRLIKHLFRYIARTQHFSMIVGNLDELL
jgi:hypothetical protein